MPLLILAGTVQTRTEAQFTNPFFTPLDFVNITQGPCSLNREGFETADISLRFLRPVFPQTSLQPHQGPCLFQKKIFAFHVGLEDRGGACFGGLPKSACAEGCSLWQAIIRVFWAY